MKKVFYLSGIFIMAIMLQSCATLLSGSRTPVRVSGNPLKAKVYYNGNYVGQAPVNVKVPRQKNPKAEVEIKAENYNPAKVEVGSRLSFGYLALDIVSGVLPVIVDFATGNIYGPYPKHITYKLEPKEVLTDKFKPGDEVLILDEKYKNIKGKVIEVNDEGLTVKFTRPANAIEKQTKKVPEITRTKREFPFFR